MKLTSELIKSLITSVKVIVNWNKSIIRVHCYRELEKTSFCCAVTEKYSYHLFRHFLSA